MSTPALGVLVGLAVTAIWAFAGFGWVLLAAVLSGLGWTVGMVAEGRLDLTRFLGHRTDGPESVHATKEN